MKITLSKFKIVLILLSGIIILSACSGSNKRIENDPSAESTANSQSVNEQTNENNEENDIETEAIATNVESVTTEKINVPTTTLTISSIEGKSTFYTSDIGGGSELARETIEILTEFDAEDIDEGTKLTLPEAILFDYDSSELLSDADEAIQKLVNLSEDIDEDITIIGHTDSRGEDDYNQKLSVSRAEAVLKALGDSGVNENRLLAKGKGATEPVAENTMSDGSDNPEGREKNRRVEVIIHEFDH